MAIRSSKGMVATVLKEDLFVSGKFSKIFAVYDGTMPSKAEIEALYSGVSLSLSAVHNLAIGNSTLRGTLIFGADLIAEQVASNFFRWETSQRSEEMDVASIGIVNWFIFAIVAKNVSSVNSNVEIQQLFVGTVSDTDNIADINIINGQVGGSENYLLNDIEVNYRV